ncbi:MAG: ABC-F type ribosomal protection protein [Eubacterium sp.]|nr:ABC-F type ribosomal protection protein [Eubacterium sp.]
MIVLSAADITKAYGTDVILDHVSFHVNAGDHIGIVGANGAGKTTLLNILTGEDTCDDGTVYMPSDLTVGYLRQKDDFQSDNTIFEETQRIYSRFQEMEDRIHQLSDRVAAMASAGNTEGEDYQRTLSQLGTLQDRYRDEGGFSYKSEMKGILTSMAFGEEDYGKEIAALSGGERTRLALATLLMEKPDLLLLDEPTNHLDIGMLKWLEQFLKSYSGTIILVSHDRYFLDQMANRIFEVEHHHLKTYDGNYTQFAEKKRAQREADWKAYRKQQEEIRRQEDMIRRFKERGTEHLAKRAASREKRLAMIDRLDRPEAERGSISMRFREEYASGTDVLYGEGLAKSFGTGLTRRQLFRDVNFDIKRGERICIVGPNGIGKTTLLRIMMGELSPDEGYLKTGHQVNFGYYDQRQEQMDDFKTVMDEVHDSYRLYKDGEIRGFLGRFLFKGDQVFVQVGSLSGGEKARLALLKLMLAGTNVLLLDEPTNHLDIDSKEVFEEALAEYPGTVIAISHDRYFLNRIATRILEMGPDGITEYVGGYDYYEEKKASIESAKRYVSELREDKGAAKAAGSSLTREQKKQQQAAERRLQREKARLEQTIEDLEKEIEETQGLMCQPAVLSDPKRLSELNEKVKKAQETLDAAYEEWMELESSEA